MAPRCSASFRFAFVHVGVRGSCVLFVANPFNGLDQVGGPQQRIRTSSRLSREAAGGGD
jgi:hypothetical protein